MDISAILTLVGSYGFPIVCCLLCFWFISKSMKEFQTAIQNNTQVMIELRDELRKEK